MALETDAGSTRIEKPKPAADDPRDAELKAARDREDALKRKYDADMAQVAAALKDPKVLKQLADQASGGVANVDESDDTALVDRKELRRHFEELKQTVAGAIVETSAQTSRITRSNTKELLRSKLKNFDKYEKEVDALLDKVNPNEAANPRTITDAYKLVRSQHADEEDAERRAEIRAEVEAELREKGWTPDEIEEELSAEETDEAKTEAKTETRTEPRRTGVAPSAALIASRATNRQRESKATWQNRDEKTAASIFGISSPEEFRRYGDRTWKPDIMGFRGRDRV